MPALPNDSDVAIQIHRGTLKSVVRDPLTLLIGARVIGQILDDRAAARASEIEFLGGRHAVILPGRSLDRGTASG